MVIKTLNKLGIDEMYLKMSYMTTPQLSYTIWNQMQHKDAHSHHFHSTYYTDNNHLNENLRKQIHLQ